MATGTTLSSALEEISSTGIKYLDCSICQERYKRPKVLDCLHSFCQNCLEEYYRRYEGAPKIPCPLCPQETVLPARGVKGLKTNFHLIGQVQEATLQEMVESSRNTKVICEICDEGNEAMYHCLDCSQNMCLNCHDMHLRFKVSSSHAVATFEDIRQGKVEVKQTPEEDGSKCQTHRGEVARFYCEPCDQLICHDCTVVNHRQHEYIESGVASLKRKQTLKDAFTAFTKDIDALEQSLAAVSQAKWKFTKKTNATVEGVQANAAKIRAEVTIQEKKIIDGVKHVQEDRNKTFDEYEKTVRMLLQRKQHSLETAKDVTNTASDGDFLSLYPTIRDGLESLSSQHPPKLDSKPLYPRFIQGQGISDINLGELEVETSKWKLCHELGRQADDGSSSKFMFARDVAVSQDGEISVPDRMERAVVIFSMDGQQKRRIPLQEHAKSIAGIQNQLAVVDRTKYVKIFNEDRMQAFQFLTVPQREDGVTSVMLESVAVKTDGTIIVGDVKRNVLTEHKTSGALIRTIPVNTEPYYLAVDSCNDRVVISDMKQVDIADTKGEVGETLFTIKPTIDGQPGDCNGVCCDESGIYISVRSTMGTGHIHHYDADGEFLGCLIQDLHVAWGITITPDGKLVVVDQSSVKMYRKM